MKKPVKIAVVLPALEVGGAERLVLNELSYLKKDSRFIFEVHVIFESGSLHEDFHTIGQRVCIWNAPHRSPRMLVTYLKLASYLRRTEFDILHNHLLNTFGPWVGKLAGTKVVTTVHSDVSYSRFEKFCLRKNDLVFACGRQVLQNIKTFIPRSRLRLLNNAIRIPLEKNTKKEAVLESLGVDKASTVVMSLGRISRVKGYDILLEAFRLVVNEVPQAVLVIGGQGPEMHKLKQIISANGMHEQVKLLGLVRDPSTLFEICDVYVNSSRYEGLPLSILEALAHRKPIVATDVGGNHEVVHDGKTGVLVEPQNAQGIAFALVKLLNDHQLRERMGRAGFSLVQEAYSIQEHCHLLVSDYLSIV